MKKIVLGLFVLLVLALAVASSNRDDYEHHRRGELRPGVELLILRGKK